jgi:hypothetical protein
MDLCTQPDHRLIPDAGKQQQMASLTADLPIREYDVSFTDDANFAGLEDMPSPGTGTVSTDNAAAAAGLEQPSAGDPDQGGSAGSSDRVSGDEMIPFDDFMEQLMRLAAEIRELEWSAEFSTDELIAAYGNADPDLHVTGYADDDNMDETVHSNNRNSASQMSAGNEEAASSHSFKVAPLPQIRSPIVTNSQPVPAAVTPAAGPPQSNSYIVVTLFSDDDSN